MLSSELRILRLVAVGFQPTLYVHGEEPRTMLLWLGREAHQIRGRCFRRLVALGYLTNDGPWWSVTPKGRRQFPRVFLGCAQPRMYVAVGIPLSDRQKRRQRRSAASNPS